MPKIDPRQKEQILAAMTDRAASYTPEWHFDTEDPDIAMALCLACADLFEGTIKKINGLPLKNQIAFYNMLNASLLPASPSEGYVSFALSAEDAPPAEVPRETAVSSYGGDDEPVHFETTDDVLVSSATLCKAFCADDSLDHIGLYEDLLRQRTDLFSLPEPNLQTHVLSVGHPFAFHLCSKGELSLGWFYHGNVPLRSQDVSVLADSSAVEIGYYAGEAGFLPFEDVKEQDGSLILTKGASQPPVQQDEDGYSLRVTVKKMEALRNFRFSALTASPSGRELLPDSISDGTTELEINAFFPFGERFQLYNEIYFGCDEVLDKRGASITMNFDISFRKIPIENQLPDEEIKWKWIAKKSDFKERASYLLTITDVIWEYYNGYGWSRLFPDNAYHDVFCCTEGVTNTVRSITFTCPEDMSPVFVGAKEDHYIRARVLKAENLYKLKGFYMSPFIRNLSFDYSYPRDGRRVEQLRSENCLEEKTFEPRSGEEFVPFYPTGLEHRAVYLGYSAPLENGPLRTLWDMKEDPKARRTELEWQYLSESGWKPMNMVDETNGFTTVGMTIFLDNHAFLKKKLFGEELYWVRVVDSHNSYRNATAAYPAITGVYENTVHAVNTDSHREDSFAMNLYTENAVFSLSAGNVLDMELYVNEYQTLSEAETEALQGEDRLLPEKDEAGMVKALWVKWQEVNTFAEADAHSRCYLLDRGAGRITFGNGRRGRIPQASDTDNIRVVYTTGGGKRSNAGTGDINSMERSIGLISTVTNPKHFYGGCDTETVYEALRRNAVMLKTQGKAVTARDLEELARFACRSIEKVKVYSGRNMAGEKENGVVTLLVLKNEHAEFSRVRKELNDSLLPRLMGQIAVDGGLQITEPTMIRMNIKTELACDSINGMFELKRKVERCLRECILAYRGREGSEEWMPGRLPNEHELRSAILRLEHIVYIRSIRITTFVTGAGGLREVDAPMLERLPYILPDCGEIDISLVQA